MQENRFKRALVLYLCMMFIMAAALVTGGCSGNAGKETVSETTVVSSEQSAETVKVLGEENKQFNFSVVDQDGNESRFEIHTDEETVGAALLKLELIAGDEGPYGLYVKTVNGMTADYDKDKLYWAFYVNDEYSTSGVDQTEIKEGEVYSFRIAK